MISQFTFNVLQVVSKIPKGKSLSYKQVAFLAGNEKAMRAVGNILKANKDLSIPCHRVIKSNGELGGYNGLRGDKKIILINEKIK